MKKPAKKKRTIAVPKGYVLRRDVHSDHMAFLYAMDRAIEFHRTNTNDPHNVGTAVMVALTEVRDCFKAYIC